MTDEHDLPDFEDEDVQAAGEAPDAADQSQSDDKTEPAPSAGDEEPDVADDSRSATATIPLAAHLAEREKRQAAERIATEVQRELQDMRRQMAEIARQSQPQDEGPDPETDPFNYLNSQIEGARAQMQRELAMQRLRYSTDAVVREYGEEAFRAAEQDFVQAARTNPQLGRVIQTHPDPARAVMEWSRGRAVQDRLSAYQGDLDALIEAEIAKRMGGGEPPDATANESAPQRPARAIPKSMAKVTGERGQSGRGIVSDEEAFDAMFPT